MKNRDFLRRFVWMLLGSFLALLVLPGFSEALPGVNLSPVLTVYAQEEESKTVRDASKIICRIFKRSPIFRVGGDEFAAIIRGNDYECLEELIGKMKDHNAKAMSTGGIVIACGMSRYDNDHSVAPVFERADINMYENKSGLKAGGEVR